MIYFYIPLLETIMLRFLLVICLAMMMMMKGAEGKPKTYLVETKDVEPDSLSFEENSVEEHQQGISLSI